MTVTQRAAPSGGTPGSHGVMADYSAAGGSAAVTPQAPAMPVGAGAAAAAAFDGGAASGSSSSSPPPSTAAKCPFSGALGALSSGGDGSSSSSSGTGTPAAAV